jgi:ribosomal protein L32
MDANVGDLRDGVDRTQREVTMAAKLVVCPECGGRLTSRRLSCPECGTLVASVVGATRRRVAVGGTVAIADIERVAESANTGEHEPESEPGIAPNALAEATFNAAASGNGALPENGTDPESATDEPGELARVPSIEPVPAEADPPTLRLRAAPPSGPNLPDWTAETPARIVDEDAPLSSASLATSVENHPADYPSIDDLFAGVAALHEVTPAIVVPMPTQREPEPVVAGSYLPPSATFAHVGADAAVPATSSSSATAAPAAASGPRLSDPARDNVAGAMSLTRMVVPASVAAWLATSGAGLAAFSVLMPWGAHGVIGTQGDPGYLGPWGLANPAYLGLLVAALGVLALQVSSSPISARLRLALVPLVFGALLLGVDWVYLAGPFGIGPGAAVSGLGGLALVAAGVVTVRDLRHGEEAPGV